MTACIWAAGVCFKPASSPLCSLGSVSLKVASWLVSVSPQLDSFFFQFELVTLLLALLKTSELSPLSSPLLLMSFSSEILPI